MKIRLVLTIDIPDPTQWTTAFGVKGAAKIRQDVKDYIGGGLRDSGIGVFANGEVDATIEYQ